MTNSGSAELAGLLSQLSEQVQRDGLDVEASDPPTSSEAMALYFVAARLAELQLRIAEREGEFENDHPEPAPAPAPQLSVVEGGQARPRRRVSRSTRNTRQKKSQG